MQNVAQGAAADTQKQDKVNGQHGVGKSSTPQSSTSSPTKSETETFSEQPRFMSDSSESEEDSVSEVESFVLDQAELDDEPRLENSKFLLSATEEAERNVDPETQARLEAILEAAGIGKLSSGDGKHLADPEVLRRLTSSVSCALDEAAAALTRMRTDNPRSSAITEKTVLDNARSLVEACSDGDVGTVRKLLTEGRSVHETTEEGESLLSLACSAGYFELAQVLLAMHANVEDRGIKGDCTPLMEAASAGHVDIVRLLIAHGADVNAQSSSGNTPLMYGCAGGHEEVVRVLLDAGSNVEDHNENGHTPLMEAASAGHVGVSKILLEFGAGINTHSNEFKESALTLACYKGHLNMVRFLLDAGADQEHKTDEMHTALMEASMDGHVEVARLLLDSGAQVNMPTDSFESPLTLAACGGHVDLAMLLIERGANIEEVNDEGYTPLMEAAREGHEEMVALLLSQGANINAQTEETQETALTLACCGGFLEVADFLIKAGADIELGASTPLMEAAQEGHIDLVRYLLESNADVHAQTQTGDTALTYACENGHTDVADILLQYGADLEHESEGGRTPLMKACRAGHLCTVQFLLQKNANVNRQTTNNDHTPLSLACAGGHLAVVELLLSQSADPFHKLKDNSTMLIEAAKGGHTSVVQLLLDYPHSIMMTPIHGATAGQHSASSTSQVTQVLPLLADTLVTSTAGLHEVPDAVRVMAQQDEQGCLLDSSTSSNQPSMRLSETHPLTTSQQQLLQPVVVKQKSLLRKNRSASGITFDSNITSAEAQQVRTQPIGEASTSGNVCETNSSVIELLCDEDNSILDKGSTGAGVPSSCQSSTIATSTVSTVPPTTGSVMEFIKARKQQQHSREEQILQKQQILEELQRVERELQVKAPNHVLLKTYGMTLDGIPPPTSSSGAPLLPGVLNIDIASQPVASNTQGKPTHSVVSTSCTLSLAGNVSARGSTDTSEVVFVPSSQSYVNLPPLPAPTLPHQTTSSPQQTLCASSEVSQNTAISDRPKAKPVSKKEGKNQRKQQQQQQQAQPQQTSSTTNLATVAANSGYHTTLQQLQHNQQHLHQINQQLQQQVLQQQQQLEQQQHQQHQSGNAIQQQQATNAMIHHLQQHQQQQVGATTQQQAATTILSHMQLLQQHTPQQLQQQVHQVLQQTGQQLRSITAPAAGDDIVGILAEQRCLFEDAEKIKHDVMIRDLDASVDDVVQTLETFSLEDVANVAAAEQEKLQVAAAAAQQQAALRGQPFDTNQIVLEEAISAMAAVHAQQGQNVAVCNQQQLQIQHQPSVGNTSQADVTRVEYFAVPTSGAPVPGLAVQHGTGLQFQYQQYQLTTGLQVAANGGMQLQTAPAGGAATNIDMTVGLQTGNTVASSHNQRVPPPHLPRFNSSPQYQAGFQAGIQKYLESQQLASACPPQCQPIVASSETNLNAPNVQPQPISATATGQYVQTACTTQQVQVATQTQQPPAAPPIISEKKSGKNEGGKSKKNRFQMVARHSNMAGTRQENGQFPNTQTYQIDPNAGVVHPYSPAQTYNPATGITQTPQTAYSCMDVDSETDSNHDTALTLACAGGHEDLVELLLSREAKIEHRDKKGFTPLILAATAGHEKVVEILLNRGAEIEAQSERTKDTPLSLACSGGRYEVVELLLSRSANKEHRNVSDYTPLSLAASGGYVNIIKLLLTQGAEINSRTGSKLGISPLMLAAMNGHTAAVKMLLDMGSDINAQIETNRNTALTLACFQGRHEVVSLLLDRKANVEHRAKTGLTPLMEAASGGYVDVGRVLLDKGADVNATPVPSSRDTALTIAADKGHCKFVELLLSRGAAVEVKNKKGNSPLWLAANGGHLNVVELLYNASADIDSQDNRKVSCLMAAFRKGHIKVVKWMVGHVTQFPSDQEMMRYISTVSDKELLEKCQDCVKVIRAAKETQAAKANKNASILLEELDMEKNREESKKAAAARRRERKKKKKLEKKEEKRKLHEENKKNETYDDKDGKKSNDEDKGDEEASGDNTPTTESPIRNEPVDKEEGDSGIDANSQGSCSSNDVKSKEKRKEKKKKKNEKTPVVNSNSKSELSSPPTSNEAHMSPRATASTSKSSHVSAHSLSLDFKDQKDLDKQRRVDLSGPLPEISKISNSSSRLGLYNRKHLVFEASRHTTESSRHPAEREDFEATGNETYVPSVKGKKLYMHYENEGGIPASQKNSATSPKQANKREEGWKEVVRKSSVQAVSSTTESGMKKVSVPLNAISRVIGRGGSNINAIRGATGAHIEVEKQSKGQGERIITIKGSAEATRHAHNLIATLIKDPEVDILQMLPKTVKSVVSTTWDKTTTPSTIKAKSNAKTTGSASSSLLGSTPSSQNKPLGSTSIAPLIPSMRSNNTVKMGTSFPPPVTRATAPRLVAVAEKRAAAAAQLAGAGTKNTMSYTTAMMAAGRGCTKVVTSSAGQTFAAKLTETTSNPHPVTLSVSSIKNKSSQLLGLSQSSVAIPTSPQAPTSTPVQQQHQHNANSAPSPKHRPSSTTTAPINMTSHSSSSKILFASPPSRIEQPLSVVTSHISNSDMLSHQHTYTSTANNTIANLAVSQQLIQQQQQQQQHHQIHQSQQQQHLQPTTQMSHMENHSAGPASVQQNRIQTLEYSLFNDTFTKVQQSMWGRENSDLQKPINFAAVTGSSVGQNNVPPKFMDNDTPQVDASKAPGYRGTAVCSPVSSKTSSNSTTPPSMSNFQNFTEQNSCIGKPTGPVAPPTPHGGLAVTRPGSRAATGGLDVGLDLSSQQPYVGRAVYPPNMPQHMDPASGLFKPPVSSTFGPDTGSLLKIVPSENQPPQIMQSFHHQQPPMQHHIGYSQPQQQGNASNPTVSMSRLNPRAPDFSSSIHGLPSKHPQQAVNMFNTSGYHPGNVIPPPSSMQSHNTNLMMNNSGVSFQLNKSSLGGGYQNQVTPRPSQNNAQQQTRWPFLPPPHQTSNNYQQDMMCLPNINHIATIAHAADYLSVLENGAGLNVVNNSPSMSPNSSNDSQRGGLNEDRKIPRPIGTERAWKHYTNTIPPQNTMNQLSADMSDPSAWMLSNEAKVAMNWSNLATGLERQQQQQQQQSQQHMFRNYPYSRLPAEEMPAMDSTFSHMDSQQQAAFQNGSTATALSLMHSLHQQFVGGPDLDTSGATGSWGDVADKTPQHGWTNKWSSQ